MIAKPNSLTPTQHIVHVKFVQNVQQNISVSSGYSGGKFIRSNYRYFELTAMVVLAVAILLYEDVEEVART